MLLTIAGYLLAAAVGYAIVHYLVIPAIRKNDGSTGTGSQSPRESRDTDKL